MLLEFSIYRSFRLAMLLATCFWQATASGQMVETAPAITVLADGTRWATPVYQVDSGVDGPLVMITAGIHGDEPAGAWAADQIRHWRLTKGKLIVIPHVNQPSLVARKRLMPGTPSGQRDLNRCFPVQTGSLPRGELAQEMWNFVIEHKPDWIIDLHEGFEFNISHQPAEGKNKSVGSSLIYFQSSPIAPHAQTMLNVVNSTIDDDRKKFVALDRGPIQGSWVRACSEQLNIPGMIIETTTKDQPMSLRSGQHRLLVKTFLASIGMLGHQQYDRHFAVNESRIKVGLYDGAGTGGGGVGQLMSLVTADEDLVGSFIGPTEIDEQMLAQFDVLVFPGGSGSAQANALGARGRQSVRHFVGQGGGYVGICAGAYLCSAHYSWSLKIIDTAVLTGSVEIEGVGKKQLWYRGPTTEVDWELTDAGRATFTGAASVGKIRYHNGPIVSPANDPLLPDYEVLAFFRSENGLYPPQVGTMVNTPAIVRATFSAGRVVSISPHPEATPAWKTIIADSIKWAHASKQPK